MHYKYLVEHLRDGEMLSSEIMKNLIPVEGLNHMMSVTVGNGSQVPVWYVSLFEGNYTPLPTNTAANFPGLATECIAYSEGTRQTFVEGAIVNGATDNSASKAAFTMTADKMLYGCALQSVAAKGATTGTLLSAVRFSVAKDAKIGDVIRISAPLSLTAS